MCPYRPPDSKDMYDALGYIVDNLFPSYDKIIIAGDFNLPNISWTYSNHTSAGTLGQNFRDSWNLSSLREILDLLITN